MEAGRQCRGRVAMIVVGDKVKDWQHVKDIGASFVDVTHFLPHDPAAEFVAGRRCTDSVCEMMGFKDAVDAVVEACTMNSVVVPHCKKGLHRSPVVSGGACEVLVHIGYSVEIMECQKTVPWLVLPSIHMMLDAIHQSVHI